MHVFDCSHCFIVRRCLISKGLELQSIAEHTVNGRPPSWQLAKHQRLLLFQVPLFLFRISLFKFISMKLSLPNGQQKGFSLHLEVLSLFICAPLHTLTLVLWQMVTGNQLSNWLCPLWKGTHPQLFLASFPKIVWMPYPYNSSKLFQILLSLQHNHMGYI